MKKLLLLLPGLFAAAPLAAQTAASVIGPWESFAPTIPYSGGAYYSSGSQSVQMPTSVASWLFMSFGGGMGMNWNYLFTSPDAGQTWVDAVGSSFRANTLVDYWALDAQRAWLLRYASNSYSLSQLNAATKTVTPVSTPPPGSPKLIRFFSETNGLLLTDVAAATSPQRQWALYRTRDGGQSWQLLPLSAQASQALANYQMSQVQGLHCWLLTPAYLLHTPDAGLTWEELPTPEALHNITFRDAQHGLATSEATGHTLYYTADGGATWQPRPTTGPRRFTSLQYISNTAASYLSCGNDRNGAPFTDDQPGTAISHDEGRTWQLLEATTSFYTLFSGPGGQVVATNGGFSNSSSQFPGLPQALYYRLNTSSVLPTTAPTPVRRAGAWPNPTTGLLHLPASLHTQATVYDATGRPCCQVTLGTAETTLDLHGLAAGMYVLHLTGGPVAPQQQQLVLAP